MTHISTEQALQIPQQLKQQGSQADTGTSSEKGKKLLSEDDVTLRQLQVNPNTKKIKVEAYKNELGKDNAIVQETLKNKLAEYRLSANTQLKVEKDMLGNVALKGALLQSDLERIGDDLNNSTAFKNSFSRLSQQKPTLDYVDNVAKLSSAYGVENNLFNSLLSDDRDYNKLNDIAHRFDSLKNAQSNMNEPPLNTEQFHFTLNA